MSENPSEEMLLSPDFATRVLETVDRHRTKRRRLRLLVSVSVLSVGLAATAVWRDLAVAPRSDVPVRVAAFTAAPNSEESGEARDTAANPISYMFPDAEPLARDAAEDSDIENSDPGILFDDEG